MKENLFAFLFLVWLLVVSVVVGLTYNQQIQFQTGVSMYAQRTDKTLQEITNFLNQQIQASQKTTATESDRSRARVI